MEDYKEMDEWAEMKQQIQLLKEQLSNEPIVNDRLIRASMQNKLSKLKKDRRIAIGMMVFLIPYIIWTLRFLLDLSWTLTGVTACFFLIALFYDMESYRGIRSEALLDKDLVEQNRKLLVLKKRNNRWLRFGIPFVCVWLFWFVGELLEHSSGTVLQGTLAGGIAGLLIGGGIGYRKYKKGQRLIDEILMQIDELTQK